MTRKPATLGELRKLPAYAPGAARRTVKEELRTNLLKKLEAGEPLFAGIHGYEDTVLPQIANAILGRHNFILLGLRGQAKSRILRGLVDFLDLEIPYIAGCQIHDNPLAALSGRRTDNSLRPFASREPRHLRGKRASGARRKNAGMFVQHDAGRRH